MLLLFGDFSHLLSGTEALQADTKTYTKPKSIFLELKLNLQLPRLKGVFEQPFVARVLSRYVLTCPLHGCAVIPDTDSQLLCPRHSNTDFFSAFSPSQHG